MVFQIKYGFQALAKPPWMGTLKFPGIQNDSFFHSNKLFFLLTLSPSHFDSPLAYFSQTGFAQMGKVTKRKTSDTAANKPAKRIKLAKPVNLLTAVAALEQQAALSGALIAPSLSLSVLPSNDGAIVPVSGGAVSAIDALNAFLAKMSEAAKEAALSAKEAGKALNVAFKLAATAAINAAKVLRGDTAAVNNYACLVPGCARDCKHVCKLEIHTMGHVGLKLFECTHQDCNKAFTTLSDQKSHFLRHNEEKTFVCSQEGCVFKTNTQQSLNIHQGTHSDERPFSCEDCDFTTRTQALLTNHELVHSNERPYACTFEGCSATFKVQGILTAHKLSHKPPTFRCSFQGCTHAAFTAGHLQRHQITHLPNQFKCDHHGCVFDTNTEDRLNRHQSKHLKNGAFRCDVQGCVFSTAHSISFKYHMMIHNGVYAAFCPECGALKRNDANLQHHIKAMHSGIVKTYVKKEEAKIAALLVQNGFAFDSGTHIDYCQDAGEKKYAFLDFVIQSPEGGVIILEVDEHSHGQRNLTTDADLASDSLPTCEIIKAGSYSVSCEQRRMMEVVAALRKDGEIRPITFLRYNPDDFKIDGRPCETSQDVREEALVKFISEWKPTKDFQIAYAFFDMYHLDEDQLRTCVCDHKDYSAALDECAFVLPWEDM
jgi:hypothetical protein